MNNSYLDELVLKEDAVTSEEVASVDEEDIAEIEEDIEEVETEEEVEPVAIKVEAAPVLLEKPAVAEADTEYRNFEAIAIRNIPDDNAPVNVISGNVAKLGTAGEYSIVQYMKPGFGLVTGYTKDI